MAERIKRRSPKSVYMGLSPIPTTMKDFDICIGCGDIPTTTSIDDNVGEGITYSQEEIQRMKDKGDDSRFY